MLSPVSLGENLRFVIPTEGLSAHVFSLDHRENPVPKQRCFQQVKSTRHSPLLQLNDLAGCSQE